MDANADNPKVKKLNLAKEKASLDEAKDRLEKYIAGVEDWEFPVDFGTERKRLLELVQAYNVSATNVTRHRRSLERVSKDKQKARAEIARQWRTNRAKLKDFFTSRHVPKQIAKILADRIYSSIADPAASHTNVPLKDVKVGIPNGSVKDEFEQPLVIPFDASKLEADQSEYEIKFAKLYLDSREAAVLKMKASVTDMTSDPKAVAMQAIGAIDVAAEFDINPTWEPEMFKDLPKLRCAIYTTWTEYVEVAVKSWPFRFLSFVLVQFAGVGTYIVIDSATAAEAGGEISEWINSQGEKELSKFPTVTLQEGACLWAPLGFHVFFMGHCPKLAKQTAKIDIKEQLKKDTSKHTIAVGVVPVFDLAHLQKQEKEMKQVLNASWALGSERLPPTWKSDAKVKAWKIALDNTT